LLVSGSNDVTFATLVDALDDVVWSVDPRQDDLASVERRLREFAAEVLGAAGVRWTIHGAAGLDRWWLDPASRRHLLLVLKEGVTNIARHAGHAPRAIREAVQALIGGTPPNGARMLRTRPVWDDTPCRPELGRSPGRRRKPHGGKSRIMSCDAISSCDIGALRPCPGSRPTSFR
jgi:hypothetical protein